ncbi:MAG: hypothetical protein V1871_00730 [Planctomycetota bacterium]
MNGTAVKEQWVPETSSMFFPIEISLKNINKNFTNFISKLEENNIISREKINLYIKKIEEFPVSYNQVFIRGSLRYLERILKLLNLSNLSHKEIQGLIKQWVRDIQWSIDSIKEDEKGFSKINLQLYKDRFYIIEDKSAQLKIFPRLKDLKVSDLAS